MQVIGLIGGVASGKSWVARQMARLGAAVLDADKAGHEVLKEPEIKQALRDRWGPAVFKEYGEVDRAVVAKIVFAPTAQGKSELAYLEHLTHPRIAERLRAEIVRLSATGVSAVVLDAPVLLKAGWNSFCNQIVFVDTPREVRLQRALQRGWTEQEFTAREAAQEPLAKKQSLADTIIPNAGNPTETAAALSKFWQGLAQ